MFHPVTTEVENMYEYAEQFVQALLHDDTNYVVIFPNNDLGSSAILNAYKKLDDNARFKIFPSLRFEYFLTLLKNSQFIIGNSSAGIREAPYYGLPAINIGTRQQNRALNQDIINCSYHTEEIIKAIEMAKTSSFEKEDLFGTGNSDQLFLTTIQTDYFWQLSKQKLFNDISASN
jgi:UDP-N-acetylglucosamine 2-epimerase (hydrolysing)